MEILIFVKIQIFMKIEISTKMGWGAGSLGAPRTIETSAPIRFSVHFDNIRGVLSDGGISTSRAVAVCTFRNFASDDM